MKIKGLLLAAGLLACGTATAGPYSDSLSDCLVGKSTMDDHVVLVRWMFVAISRHPAVSTMATISDAEVDNANKQMAELFTRLLTVTCRDQAKLALKNEGQFAMQQAFQKLGQQAGSEIFINQDVAKGMSGITKYFDDKKLQELQSQ
ncbi:hypothetical protein [Pinirhizobacter soli]|uniref:hypothetical protein n=1 Tax=Pinirhizobacter soli TaxID=2786953 RepID=UPI002029DB78|nr:hypothetical protein [Pinirhizobacter soli]